jgi:hypothetical protein
MLLNEFLPIQLLRRERATREMSVFSLLAFFATIHRRFVVELQL